VFPERQLSIDVIEEFSDIFNVIEDICYIIDVTEEYFDIIGVIEEFSDIFDARDQPFNLKGGGGYGFLLRYNITKIFNNINNITKIFNNINNTKILCFFSKILF
jgi:hypothetical protein